MAVKGLKDTNHTSYRFCPQKDPKPNQKHKEIPKTHRSLEKIHFGRHDAVIASRLRLDR